MHVLRHALALLLFSLVAVPCHAEKIASIIIDDIGNHFERGKAVIDFPAAITLAILPRIAYSKKLAILAHENNKEVMLHLPMQSIENHTRTPGTLSLHMTHQQFADQLRRNIESVPHIKGINNHMGSLLTRHPGHMSWLMREIARNDSLYFIDSRTTDKSLAASVAAEYNVPNLPRDVFLDPDNSYQTLRTQFDRLIDITNRQGHAIAIAHPYPSTLQFIKDHLDELAQHNIKIVPVSELIASLQKQQEEKQHVTCTGTTCAGM
ncbi:MAG: divergent polysaccharide deacetylase family protein [Gammaproteobacteria bacterium]